MYATCMFCTKDLGRNESVEHFPIGKRLAFDAARGRLWVVCIKCGRWNLTPLEERWEAVEECEILFERTRVRSQTENVGLARLPDGTTLVRIGDPRRLEFAAWRYGDQFGRRRKKAFVIGGIAAVGILGVAIGGVAVGAISGGLAGQAGNFVNLYFNGRTLAKVKTADGEVLKLRRPDLSKARIVESGQGQGWGVLIQKKEREVVFEGEDAREVTARLMARINSAGGGKSDVEAAVGRIESFGDPEAFLKTVSSAAGRKPGRRPPGTIGQLTAPDRLALEMALHEESEMRALQGELWQLEQRWREAEEIASIADGLLLPDRTADFLDEHR